MSSAADWRGSAAASSTLTLICRATRNWRSSALVQAGDGAARRRPDGPRRPARDSSPSSISSKTPSALFGPDGTLLFANPAMDTALGLPAETRTTRRRTPPAVAAASRPPVPRDRRSRADRREPPTPRRPSGARTRATPAHCQPRARRRRRASRRDARLAQPRLYQPGGVHAQLLAQAARAQPPVGGHRARNQEPAQRHDDPSRAAPHGARRSPTRSSTSTVIAGQVRRLDEVVQGFLKFTRPEDLHLRAVDLGRCSSRFCRSSRPKPSKYRVEIAVDVPPALPPVEGDASLLQQAS